MVTETRILSGLAAAVILLAVSVLVLFLELRDMKRAIIHCSNEQALDRLCERTMSYPWTDIIKREANK